MSLRMAVAAAATVLAGESALAREIYVSNEKDNTISVVDGDQLTVKETIEVGNRPRGIDLSPDGRYL